MRSGSGQNRGRNGQIRGKSGQIRGMRGQNRGRDGQIRGMRGQIRGRNGQVRMRSSVIHDLKHEMILPAVVVSQPRPVLATRDRKGSVGRHGSGPGGDAIRIEVVL